MILHYKGYTELGTTWANEMNLGINHALDKEDRLLDLLTCSHYQVLLLPLDAANRNFDNNNFDKRMF